MFTRMAPLLDNARKMITRLLVCKELTLLQREVLSMCNVDYRVLLGVKNDSIISKRHFNSNRASICRLGRKIYTRLYPTLLVQPDGSTVTIRHPLPQKIIMLPIDISKMSEEERARHLLKRKPKQKVVIREEIEDDFDPNQYSHLWKK